MKEKKLVLFYFKQINHEKMAERNNKLNEHLIFTTPPLQYLLGSCVTSLGLHAAAQSQERFRSAEKKILQLI